VTSTLTLTLRLKRGMFDSQRYLKIIADLCSRNKKKSNRIKLQKKIKKNEDIFLVFAWIKV